MIVSPLSGLEYRTIVFTTKSDLLMSGKTTAHVGRLAYSGIKS